MQEARKVLDQAEPGLKFYQVVIARAGGRGKLVIYSNRIRPSITLL